MQTIRGTKDILPNEIQQWQHLYLQALNLLSLHNYHEIRTPVLEPTELFTRSIGNDTDIINKEMYSFQDQGQRNITLRPEGTAAIARAYISNKLYSQSTCQKLWYLGPMFRYERPQSGRQRQFHQLGIEYIGNNSPLADVEVIHLAHSLLQRLQYTQYTLEINSLGTEQERYTYKNKLINYLQKYKNDIDNDSKKRLENNPLRILDSKNKKTQTILQDSPKIYDCLGKTSLEHFHTICENLETLKIPFTINNKLVRGLDYYNHTAFEIVDKHLGNQTTLCGGGRYNKLIKELGGPDNSGVGWAIGIERLFLTIKNEGKVNYNRFFIVTQGVEAQKKSWNLMQKLQDNNIHFNLDFSDQNLQKKIKKAVKAQAIGCLIIGTDEIRDDSVTVKWLKQHYQETIDFTKIIQYLTTKTQ